jgi:hypothetical protein
MKAASYGPVIDSLLTPARLCGLGPGQPNDARKQELAALTLSSAFPGKTIIDLDAARCCLAGLWLLHDFLDESHTISQESGSTNGSYWHGIMHRREPDYENSKYWFRRVEEHPIFPDLARAASELIQVAGAEDTSAAEIQANRRWDPFRFVFWCKEIAIGKAKQKELAQQVAQTEWQLLFEHCYRCAVYMH